MPDRVRAAAAPLPAASADCVEDDAPQAQDLVLVPVRRGAWRVCDRRRPDGDPLRLLAFVEHRAGVFEVMQLGSRFEWHEFETLEEAVEHVRRTGPRLARLRQSGDLAWIG